MYVQVKDSAVPKRETTVNVSRITDQIVICLDDKHVTAIGLALYLTDTEAFELATTLLQHISEVRSSVETLELANTATELLPFIKGVQ